MTEYYLQDLAPEDQIPVIDIFNYYIENSFAAYPETKVPYEFYPKLLEMVRGYPAITLRTLDEIIGFGFLRPYHSMPVFRRTAEISYFLKTESTGLGLGKLMLDYLAAEALKQNIDCILASISSLNENSLRFHAKHGFVECGRLKRIGRKKGQDFDVVWMQKLL